MNLQQLPPGILEKLNSSSVAVEDRRIHDRLTLMKTIHVSSFDDALTQETATVVDISREGLYFTANSRHYRMGMEMRVAIPGIGFEGLCKVVRIEELPSGCLGIGCINLGW